VTHQADSADQTGEQRYRHLFENAPICIFVIDLTVDPVTIREVNRRAELLYGYPAAEMIGMPAVYLVPDEAETVIQTTVQQVRQGQRVTVEATSRRRDGTLFPVRVIAAPDPTDGSDMIVTVENISAEKERRTEAEAIDAERRRIAHEIHDGVAQSLAGLRFKSAFWSSLADAVPPDMRAALDELQTVLNDAIADLRRAIFALRPLDLESLGLLPTLTQLVGEFGDQNQLAARLDVSGSQDALPVAYELPLFRIIQEGLNNIGQHAGATLVLVRLTVDMADGVRAVLRDNGCGFDPRHLDSVDRKDHFGLRQMRERIVDLGGTLDIDSTVGHGTELVITLPPLVQEGNHAAD
jgi:two-component system sensor histidine kinase DegS